MTNVTKRFEEAVLSALLYAQSALTRMVKPNVRGYTIPCLPKVFGNPLLKAVFGVRRSIQGVG